MKILVEFNDCTDCPFKTSHRGHGECWEQCSNPENNRKAYEDILWGCQEEFTKVPGWCPILLKEELNENST